MEEQSSTPLPIVKRSNSPSPPSLPGAPSQSGWATLGAAIAAASAMIPVLSALPSALTAYLTGDAEVASRARNVLIALFIATLAVAVPGSFREMAEIGKRFFTRRP